MTKTIAYIVLVLIFTPIIYAHALNNPASGLFVNFASNDLNYIITTIIRIMLGVIGVFALISVILGGFQIMMSGTNPTLYEKGKKTVKYSLTGLIITILSYIIVTVIVNSLRTYP